jgi:hypothetical protein
MAFEVLHYRPRKISELRKNDLRVALIGEIKEVRANSFILWDGSGEIEIFSEKSLEKGKLVRVFCLKEGEEFKAQVIQDLKGFDLNLYKRIRELYNRVGLNV